MKYIIEDGDCNVIKAFSTESDRMAWLEHNCCLELTEDYIMAYHFNGKRIYFYEEA